MARTKMEALKANDGKGKAKKTKKEKQNSNKNQVFDVIPKEEGAPAAGNSTQEIRYYQSNTELLIPKVSFQRLVRDVCKEIGHGVRMEAQALLCLQESTEAFLCGLFEDASLFALHSRRVTVMKRDLQLSRKIRNCDEAGSKKFEEDTGKKEEPVADAPKSTTPDTAEPEPETQATTVPATQAETQLTQPLSNS